MGLLRRRHCSFYEQHDETTFANPFHYMPFCTGLPRLSYRHQLASQPLQPVLYLLVTFKQPGTNHCFIPSPLFNLKTKG
jgi:hypothetical protein